MFETGNANEFEMSYERSVDRHKDKIKYCTDVMAIGFSSWALPHVIKSFIKVLRFTPDKLTEEGKGLGKFQNQLRSALEKFGVKGPEQDDGWVVYPTDDANELTAHPL